MLLPTHIQHIIVGNDGFWLAHPLVVEGFCIAEVKWYVCLRKRQNRGVGKVHTDILRFPNYVEYHHTQKNALVGDLVTTFATRFWQFVVIWQLILPNHRQGQGTKITPIYFWLCGRLNLPSSKSLRWMFSKIEWLIQIICFQLLWLPGSLR